MGDRPTQNTLGVFMGTFVYCLLVLRTVQGGPEPFVPAASVSLAMALAVGALAWLVYFIHTSRTPSTPTTSSIASPMKLCR